MHSPIIFAITETSPKLDALKAATSKEQAVESFGAEDSETLTEQLQNKMGSDWWYDKLDATEERPWDVTEALGIFGGTLTKESDQLSWWELTKQQCRKILQSALEAQIFILQTNLNYLKATDQPVNTTHPFLTKGLDDDLTCRLLAAVHEVEGFPFASSSYGGVAFVVADEYDLTVMSFGELVTQSVSAKTGLRLAVATGFNGDYHY